MEQKIDLKKYQQLCQNTAKGFAGDKEKEIVNWGLGVAGEAGDLAGCIKKTVFHKNDQVAGIRENIGDTMWYLAMICNCYGWDFEEVLQENIDKLAKRYPQGFTEKDAQRNGSRVDWNEKSN
jgi:NTP pyrophosphatase (non-canonical NTP hydrolase)